MAPVLSRPGGIKAARSAKATAAAAVFKNVRVLLSRANVHRRARLEDVQAEEGYRHAGRRRAHDKLAGEMAELQAKVQEVAAKQALALEEDNFTRACHGLAPSQVPTQVTIAIKPAAGSFQRGSKATGTVCRDLVGARRALPSPPCTSCTVELRDSSLPPVPSGRLGRCALTHVVLGLRSLL